jgi:hypothetical protein
MPSVLKVFVVALDPHLILGGSSPRPPRQFFATSATKSFQAVTITKDCPVQQKSLKPTPTSPIFFSYGELNQQHPRQPKKRSRKIGSPQTSATADAENHSATVGHGDTEKR